MKLPLSFSRWTLDESIIGSNPGLGLRPRMQDSRIDSSMYVLAAGIYTASYTLFCRNLWKFMKFIQKIFSLILFFTKITNKTEIVGKYLNILIKI